MLATIIVFPMDLYLARNHFREETRVKRRVRADFLDQLDIRGASGLKSLSEVLT